jgi:hypothetical protein
MAQCIAAPQGTIMNTNPIRITPKIEEVIKDFLNDNKTARESAKELNVSTTAFAFLVMSVVRRWVDEGKVVTP